MPSLVLAVGTATDATASANTCARAVEARALDDSSGKAGEPMDRANRSACDELTSSIDGPPACDNQAGDIIVVRAELARWVDLVRARGARLLVRLDGGAGVPYSRNMRNRAFPAVDKTLTFRVGRFTPLRDSDTKDSRTGHELTDATRNCARERSARALRGRGDLSARGRAWTSWSRFLGHARPRPGCPNRTQRLATVATRGRALTPRPASWIASPDGSVRRMSSKRRLSADDARCDGSPGTLGIEGQPVALIESPRTALGCDGATSYTLDARGHAFATDSPPWCRHRSRLTETR